MILERFPAKACPDLIRGGGRFARRKRVKTRNRAPFRFNRNGKGSGNDGGRERWVRRSPHVPADCEGRSLQGNPPEPRIGFPATKAPWKGPTQSSPQRTPSKRTPPGSRACARQRWIP